MSLGSEMNFWESFPIQNALSGDNKLPGYCRSTIAVESTLRTRQQSAHAKLTPQAQINGDRCAPPNLHDDEFEVNCDCDCDEKMSRRSQGTAVWIAHASKMSNISVLRGFQFLQAPSMKTGRNHAASCTDGERMFVFGGRSGKNVVGPGYSETQVL
jgi:hypothetical protein